MKTLAAVMAAFLVLALFAREMNWKTRGLLLGAVIVMVLVLSR